MRIWLSSRICNKNVSVTILRKWRAGGPGDPLPPRRPTRRLPSRDFHTRRQSEGAGKAQPNGGGSAEACACVSPRPQPSSYCLVSRPPRPSCVPPPLRRHATQSPPPPLSHLQPHQAGAATPCQGYTLGVGVRSRVSYHGHGREILSHIWTSE